MSEAGNMDDYESVLEIAAMTRQLQLENVCPITDEQCRFLSMEWTSRIFTKLKKDSQTGLFIPDKMGSRKVMLGYHCSNHVLKHSGWVSQITICPVVEGKNAVPVKIPVARGRDLK